MKTTLLSLLFLCLAGCSGGDRTFISIGTGAQTGVYFPVGGAIKQLVEEIPGRPLHVSVKVSRGSEQNLNDVMGGTVSFGIAQADRVYQAFRGLDAWQDNPQQELRFVLSLHPEVVTLIAAEDMNIRKVADLRGKRVNIGNPGSGQLGNALDILRVAGLDPQRDLLAENLTVGECAGMLQDHRIDAYFYTVGHPNGSITEATSGRRKVRMVPIDGMEALIAASPFYTPAMVPVSLYPQAVQEGSVPSIGMRTTLVTRADTPEETVYLLVKAVFENLDRLREQHPALADLQAKEMIQGGQAPTHPGATRYFRESGLLP